ncbi:hypothetical protein MXB_3641 [Myxobolus squamalis]|nr:hypothetical protein MXB_3641 [Myxobolus squamalis]
MEKMGKIITEVTSKYSFCNRNMSFHRERCKALVKRIQSDLQLKIDTVRGLDEQLAHSISTVNDQIYLFEGAMNISTIREALSKNLINSAEESVTKTHKALLERRRIELKTTFDAFNYLFNIYSVLFPEIIIDI